jgi:hypothetical protein
MDDLVRRLHWCRNLFCKNTELLIATCSRSASELILEHILQDLVISNFVYRCVSEHRAAETCRPSCPHHSNMSAPRAEQHDAADQTSRKPTSVCRSVQLHTDTTGVNTGDRYSVTRWAGLMLALE